MNKPKIHLTINRVVILAVVVLSFIFLFYDVSFAQNLNAPDPTTQVYKGDLAGNPIVGWINFFINLLSVVIIVGAGVMMAWAGIQYSASRDNASGIEEAKKKIYNVLLGLVAYFFMYAFVQWLIPGGVF